MPWILHDQRTSSPGAQILTPGPTTENQSFMIDFPDFPEEVVRRWGTLWRRARNAAPANRFVAQRQSWIIWHNGTQVYNSTPGLGGAMVFQTFEKFGSDLTFRLWRFDP